MQAFLQAVQREHQGEAPDTPNVVEIACQALPRRTCDTNSLGTEELPQ